MKKLNPDGSHMSMDDAEWERIKGVVATTRTLGEVSEILEQDTAIIHRKHRPRGESSRPHRGRPSTDFGAEDFAGH